MGQDQGVRIYVRGDLHLHQDVLQKDVSQLIAAVTALSGKVDRMDTQVQAALDKLSVEVNRQTDIETSVKTLLEGLAAQIAALKVGQTDPAVIAALDAAAELVRSNNDKLAADVVANTPQP